MSAADVTPFAIEEATITDIHAALAAGVTTVVAIVKASLDRIAAYDARGPRLGLVVEVNPNALAEAAALDGAYARTGKLAGPMHGVPVLVKDNYDVAGLQTTGGSAALRGWIPARDAAVVAKLRAAGAIILAKVTMSEWARGGLDNINSVLPGFARNPYNTAYATGGSSGGTGGGLAASFGVVGLGSDTWGSIRNPSSNNALVGLRPSWGLVSREGMIGLYANRDTAGPMARTVTDLARTLEVIADEHADAALRAPKPYSAYLDSGGARGKRIGVLRQAFPPDASDPDVSGLVQQAIRDLHAIGAEIVDPVTIPEFAAHPSRPHPESEVRAALELYLATTGAGFPKTVAELVATGKFHPLHEVGLKSLREAPSPADDPIVRQLEADEANMRTAYLAAMREAKVDVLIMPTASYPPKLNGDRNTTPAGAATWIASGLHWPALVVPMGYTGEDLPSGLQIMGRPGSDAMLIEIGFAYEQATHHRKPPATTPPLPGRSTAHGA